MAFVWSPASDIEVAGDFFCNKLFVETIGMGGGNYTALNDFKTWIGANRAGTDDARRGTRKQHVVVQPERRGRCLARYYGSLWSTNGPASDKILVVQLRELLSTIPCMDILAAPCTDR
jgi:hypothetical protein